MYFPIIFIFLLYSFDQYAIECFFDWRSATRQLKDKIKNLYKQRLLKTRESVSVGPRPSSPLDYPRTLEIQNVVDNIWKEYYNCLETKRLAIASDNSLPPYTVAAFTDTYVQLDCNVCASPEDLIEYSEWHYTAKPYIDKPAVVEEDEFKQISGYTFTLNFYNLKKFHEGMYFCNLKNDVDAPYFLHVLDANEPTKEVKPKSAKKGPYPESPLKIAGSELILWNEWTTWTDCSICGKVGKRTRIGYCKVSLFENVSEEIKMTTKTTPKPMNISVKAIQETEGLLQHFVYGIPCRSTLLLKLVREHHYIKNYSTEVMTGFCKVDCPSEVMVQVVNNKGAVIETVNNTAGEYSVYQELPPQPAAAERVNIYADLNKTFILPCPNYLYKETPVEWSVGGKIWKRDVVEKMSNGRIKLNDLNEIVFMYLEEIDLKIYSCSQKKKLVGVVKLNANYKPSYTDDYFATLSLYPKIMLTSILLTFLYVSLKMLLNSSKAAAGEYVPFKKGGTFIEFLIDTYHDRYLEPISDKTTTKTPKIHNSGKHTAVGNVMPPDITTADDMKSAASKPITAIVKMKPVRTSKNIKAAPTSKIVQKSAPGPTIKPIKTTKKPSSSIMKKKTKTVKGRKITNKK